jgi:arylsulfatase A-like enzyme
VLNNDLAPTFAQLGGVIPPSFVDGRSLVPLLDSTPPALSDWRQRFLVEQYHPQYSAPDYRAVRTRYRIYVRYVDGQRELYLLTKDPYELNSKHRTASSALLSSLKAKLDALKTCAANSCRAAEN